MKYLLDTHALWHHASDGDGLSERAAICLDGSAVEDLVVLDVSLYELARHIAVGRIEVESPLQTLATIERSYPMLHSDAEIAWNSASLRGQGGRGGALVSGLGSPQAQDLGLQLLARDPGRYTRYFPEVKLIVPELG